MAKLLGVLIAFVIFMGAMIAQSYSGDTQPPQNSTATIVATRATPRPTFTPKPGREFQPAMTIHRPIPGAPTLSPEIGALP